MRTGAASFKRWLGCAPNMVARVPPLQPELKRPRHRRSTELGSRLGRIDRRSELTRGSGPRTLRDFHYLVIRIELKLPRRIRHRFSIPSAMEVWKTGLVVALLAQPNGSRLSCGALKKESFHNLRAPSASSAC